VRRIERLISQQKKSTGKTEEPKGPDPNVKAIMINIFGGILKVDVLAEGIVAAAQELKIGVPMVLRLEGTNVEKGREILADSGLDFIVASDMKEAAQQAVARAG